MCICIHTYVCVFVCVCVYIFLDGKNPLLSVVKSNAWIVKSKIKKIISHKKGTDWERKINNLGVEGGVETKERRGERMQASTVWAWKRDRKKQNKTKQPYIWTLNTRVSAFWREIKRLIFIAVGVIWWLSWILKKIFSSELNYCFKVFEVTFTYLF